MKDEATTGSVLLVDDDPVILAAFERGLTGAGFSVERAQDGRQAVDRVEHKRFDTIVSDISMPELDGIGLLRAVRERDLDVPVVLVTGDASLSTAMEAIECGALRYLQKPIAISELVAVVKHAVCLGKMARVKREASDLLGDQTKVLGDRMSLELGFKRALEGLWIAYQPIVSYSRRSVIAYEALMRSTDRTLPHPGAIIDAAQRLGQLAVLGRAVRERVAKTMAEAPGLQVFVNLHPTDLHDDELYSKTAPLSAFASRVVLEITERASIDEVRDAQVRVAHLRRLGFRIAIDDVGAGYAGLTSVAQLEPEVMKIDMSLVRDVNVSATKQKLVGAMATLCAEMQVMVIAEGIENRFERDTVLRLGCEHMQGYLFAKPDKPFPQPTFDAP